MSKKVPVNSPCPCRSGKKYKKCCGSPTPNPETPLLRAPKIDDVELIAYTDESGNSGMNLFDRDQPFFWTGTLVTEVDIEAIAAPVVAECLQIAGRKELHGNDLGLGGINKIAPLFLRLFAETHSHFVFTIIEKTHLAGTKFADTILDNGINQAMSLAQYGPPAARLPLALQLIQLLEYDDLTEWWDAFERNDAKAFARVMQRVLYRLDTWHGMGIYHDRTVQLLSDALKWGIAHPQKLMGRGAHPFDSPNIVALTLVLDALHTLNGSFGARVRTFIHDEQNEFARHLTRIHGLAKGFSLDSSNICAPLPIVRKTVTFGCELEMRESSKTYGLQLIDVVLWLTKRFVETRGEIHGDAGELARYIVAKGQMSRLTRSQMIQQVNNIWEELHKLPITEEMFKKGREVLAEIETKRIARMNGPVEE